MIIIPAIDILGGKCVRLFQGDYGQSTTYSLDPLEVALDFQQKGASLLHIVDLDGAREGSTVNFGIISKIAAELTIPIEVGGGIRNREAIKKYLEIKVLRVILGTIVLEDFNFAKEAFEQFGNQIIVGLDAKEGLLMTKGWITESGLNVFKTARKLEELGAKRFIYTDISKDGSLSGPNFKSLKKLIEEINSPVIASGGVSEVNQIRQLKNIGAEGVILGKALYEGKIDLEEALNVS
ncbi:MAG TPA: 1-(5-phosphoribosyl)-5-[(5-phosphoribosylamino)methylideneamino]imidazole-4-carboxamide isomerase [Patescibacteria group bacterium]|nr:1-(5-phosphoribosyl)-5-[(5-phosphoribosylamino)methylideneamino]imidazole-4-carboxamide isomerase [Patescibacteria group bacterium]